MDQFFQFVISHWILWLVFVLLLILLLQYELSAKAGGLLMISPQQMTHFINRENALVLDIRDKDTFAKGHITSALSFEQQAIEKQLKKIQKHTDKPLILIAEANQPTGKLAAQLKQAGFDKLYGLKGGMTAWRSANMPLVKD